MKQNKIKRIISMVMIILVIGLSMLACSQNNKGGEDALSVFDVNSKEIKLTYHDKTVCLTDKKQEQFVKLIKGICEEKNAENNDDIEYDMQIDFNNGYTAKISTEKKLFLFDGDVKKLTNETLETIFDYFK